ncbi:hypothetical protein OROGR_006134 [Orobanche gracilis]
MLVALHRVLEESSPVLIAARADAEERRNNIRLREEQDAACWAALEVDQLVTKKALLISADSDPMLGCYVNLEPMVKMLTDHCHVERCNISTLVNMDSKSIFVPVSVEANRENVVKALSTLRESVEKGESKVALVYLVGHSSVVKGKAYFTCSDDKLIEGSYFRHIAKSMSQNCRLYFLMDTCYAGVFFEGYIGNGADSEMVLLEMDTNAAMEIEGNNNGFLRKAIDVVS